MQENGISVGQYRYGGYTLSMKTAISIPDAVYLAGEKQAQRMHTSRSQLYTEALSEYLTRHAPDEVTDAMNQTLEQIDQIREPFIRVAATKVLEQTEW